MVDRIPDSPAPDLMEQAASGSSAAQLYLADLAIDAGKRGTARPVEALIAAETWARLAAASGGIGEQWGLVSVLLNRAEFETRTGRSGMATWYEGEARRVLKLLVALDVVGAADTLASMDADSGLVDDGDASGPNPQELALLGAAAKGDRFALDTLAEQALSLLYSGQVNAVEALTVAELYARLGAASGYSPQMRRLAGVLLKRAEFEYGEGLTGPAYAAVSEAAVLVSIMAECSDPSMAPWLAVMGSEFPIESLVAAIRFRPTLLNFIEPRGTC